MKLCKDCIHYHPALGYPAGDPKRAEFSRCAASPKAFATTAMHLVDGRPHGEDLSYCDIARQFGDCGPEGKKFEPEHAEAAE